MIQPFLVAVIFSPCITFLRRINLRSPGGENFSDRLSTEIHATQLQYTRIVVFFSPNQVVTKNLGQIRVLRMSSPLGAVSFCLTYFHVLWKESLNLDFPWINLFLFSFYSSIDFEIEDAPSYQDMLRGNVRRMSSSVRQSNHGSCQCHCNVCNPKLLYPTVMRWAWGNLESERKRAKPWWPEEDHFCCHHTIPI